MTIAWNMYGINWTNIVTSLWFSAAKWWSQKHQILLIIKAKMMPNIESFFKSCRCWKLDRPKGLFLCRHAQSNAKAYICIFLSMPREIPDQSTISLFKCSQTLRTMLSMFHGQQGQWRGKKITIQIQIIKSDLKFTVLRCWLSVWPPCSRRAIKGTLKWWATGADRQNLHQNQKMMEALSWSGSICRKRR